MKYVKFTTTIILLVIILLPVAVYGAQQEKKGVREEIALPIAPPPPIPPTPELYEEGEEGADDQNQEASGLKKQNQGVDKGLNDKPLTRRSRVANAVQEMFGVADRIGGIGEQVRIIARIQNQNQEQIESGLDAVKNRGKLKKFFFGPDYKRLSTVEEKLANHSEKLAELKALLGQIASEEDKTILEAQIKVMEQAAVEIQKEASSEKKGFSLFGWLNQMLSK
ncbi:hypothetical protein DRH27_02990 [Candidatus Falkowbacteria bacterium]|nr:MAG: hypothetical protein DRH27_02990 [Candidatus Falkowbacteria bacterium]